MKRIIALSLIISVLLCPVKTFAEINADFNLNFDEKAECSLTAEFAESAEFTIAPELYQADISNLETIAADENHIDNVCISDNEIQHIEPQPSYTPNSSYQTTSVGSLCSSDNVAEPLDTVSTTTPHLASSNSSSGYSENYRSLINGSDAFSVQNASAKTNFSGDSLSSDYVDPLTGDLTVLQSDLVLPGRDGFDLKLERIYSSAQAGYFTPNAGIQAKGRTRIPEGCYIVEATIFDHDADTVETEYYVYSDYDNADIRRNEIETRDSINGRYSYMAGIERCNEERIVDLGYCYSSNSELVNYQRSRCDLGVGWSWAFPSLQLVRNDQWNFLETPKGIYFHTGNGGVITLTLNSRGEYSFENYDGKDIEFFEIYDTDIASSVAVYEVDYSDGRKLYFGYAGELLAMTDSFGNKITFEYTDKEFYTDKVCRLISKITDSVGRTLNFSYSEQTNYSYINISVGYPGSPDTLNLKYTKRMIDVNNSAGETVATEPILTKFENIYGQNIYYEPALIYSESAGDRVYATAAPVKFTFGDKRLDSLYTRGVCGYTNNLMYLLGKITYPEHYSEYEYAPVTRNLGHSGVTESYRIISRTDGENLAKKSDGSVNLGDNKNYTSYEYSETDYTGYPYYISPGQISASEEIYSEKRSISGVCERNTYKFSADENALLLYKKDISNESSPQVKYEYAYDGYITKKPTETLVTKTIGGSEQYSAYVFTSYYQSDDAKYGKVSDITKPIRKDLYDSGSLNRDLYTEHMSYDRLNGKLTYYTKYLNTGRERYDETYSYSSDGRLTKEIYPEDKEISYSYETNSPKGYVTKRTVTKKNGSKNSVCEEIYTAETNYAYPTKVTARYTDSNGSEKTRFTQFTYDMLFGKPTSATDDNGNVTYYEYDASGRLVKTVYPAYETYTSTKEKTKILRVDTVKYTDMTAFSHPSYNSAYMPVVSRTEVNTVCYDITDTEYTDVKNIDLTAAERLYSNYDIVYRNGFGQTLAHSYFDKITGEDNPTLMTEYAYYNYALLLSKETDAAGNQKTYEYDDFDRIKKATDIHGNIMVYEYDILASDGCEKALTYFVAADKQNGFTNADKQNVRETTYDMYGRAVEKRAYNSYPSDFAAEHYTYDIDGRCTGYTDANQNKGSSGYTEKYTYDPLGRLISAVDANDTVTETAYDSFDNITSQKIGEKPLFEKSYDNEGKLTSDTDPLGNAENYSYDNLGRTLNITKRNGVRVSYEYDEAGNISRNTMLNTAGGVENRSMNITPGNTDRIYEISYTATEKGYEGLLHGENMQSISPSGRILSATYSSNIANASGKKFGSRNEYEYDSMGNTVLAYSGTKVNTGYIGTYTRYNYNRDRITSVQLDGEKSESEDKALYEFYADGKLKSVIMPLSDGTELKSEYEYNGYGELVALTNSKGENIIEKYEYTYDLNGNTLLSKITRGETVRNIRYTYDKKNRIIGCEDDSGLICGHSYDSMGNRKTELSGNDLLGSKSAVYRYDAADRMYYAKTGDDTTVFDYNSTGLRYLKRENGNDTYYVYDKSGRLALEAKIVSVTSDTEQQIIISPTSYYIWGSDRIIAKVDILTNKRYYYIYNGHGDVTALIDENGEVANRYDYDVWGNFTQKEETVTNPFTYFGQTYDETTGLYYLRARYYDPTTGRFTQQDPAKDGYNWYVYGNNNPVMFVDESGENIMSIPWVRQQIIWKNGVRALNLADLPVSAQMLDHSIRWFYAEDVNITENGVSGSDRINKDNVINMFKNSPKINNEVDWLTKCYGADNKNTFAWTGVLGLNENTDSYLSFNNATVTLVGSKDPSGNWNINVNVFDVYDFDREKISSINSLKTAIGSAAGTYAWMEQTPLLGAIKTYKINVNFNVTR